MRNAFTRFPPESALLADAVACFVGAVVLLLSPRVWNWTDLPADWREPVVVALFLFSVLLVIAARYPNRALVSLAVLGNLLWIAGGAIALIATGTLLGGIVITSVMIGDAIMAWLQARLLGGGFGVARNNA